MKTNKPKITLVVPVEIEVSRFADVLCCAFEGGSNYWYRIEKFVPPTEFLVRIDDKQIFKHIDYPVNPGGSLIVSNYMVCDQGERPVRRKLNLASIKKGALVMASKYPSHWANLMNENFDADTGDVFLQCCLFGEALYG
jgi:hypothetical protein